MREIIEKLFVEETELTKKIHNLEIFLHKQRENQTISDTQYDLLTEQIWHMREYAEILRIRIADLTEQRIEKETSKIRTTVVIGGVTNTISATSNQNAE